MWVGQPYLLTQRLLWNRALSGPSRPQPVVVLLGPVGSGKSEALKSISSACGAEVVHALVDFQRAEPTAAEPTTVETLTRVAEELSRDWIARPKVRFTRFTLGLIAVQTPLKGLPPDAAKEKLRTSIEKFTRSPRVVRVINGLVDRLVDTASALGIPLPLPAEIIKSSLPALIRFVARRPVSKAKRWHADMPEAEGATLLDALFSLNRANLTTITEWLTAAFLADVRESHLRMAKPDGLSQCDCSRPNQDKVRHWHNWVLLLDNIDHPGGMRFVRNLLAARDRHLWQHPGEHDPLLVVATSGRWDRHWETEWRAPWRSPQENTGPARTVSRCSEACYKDWAGQEPRSPYYPVLLDPLTIDEIASILEIDKHEPACILAYRATGGLPEAVRLLKDLLRGQQLQPGARDVLSRADPDRAGADPWRERLAALRLTRHLTDVSIEEIITAAPFITAPWLIPPAAAILTSRPHVGRILTELRTALWITAPQQGGASPNTKLNPWLARTLTSALAQNGACYSEQFKALLNEPDSLSDPARTAYCQLALEQIGEVVDAFEASFDQGPHQEWVDRLELAASAPDALPLDRSCGELYDKLITVSAGKPPGGRSQAGIIIARLLSARWLVVNPFAVNDQQLRDITTNAYGKELPSLSHRSDVAALYRAAELAADPLR
jgi:hypothetical protein